MFCKHDKEITKATKHDSDMKLISISAMLIIANNEDCMLMAFLIKFKSPIQNPKNFIWDLRIVFLYTKSHALMNIISMEITER